LLGGEGKNPSAEEREKKPLRQKAEESGGGGSPPKTIHLNLKASLLNTTKDREGGVGILGRGKARRRIKSSLCVFVERVLSRGRTS